MESEENMKNPLKRSFDIMKSKPELAAEAMEVDKDKSFTPRDYQVKTFEVAMKRNTIAVLETGAGKTLIAVMMINQIGQSIKLDGIKKLIIFLAPTVHLVHQQYEVIKSSAELEVQEYYGARGVDEWKAETWDKEINHHDVFVMTPQILLDTLRKAFLSLNTVCLLILDECHHANGNHPYAKIMQEFYHKSRSKPKIFGMTASPVIRKGVTSMRDCEGQISELESLLDSQIYTTENRAELEEFIPSAKEICRFYDTAVSSYLELKAKLDSTCSKFDAVLLKLQESQPVQYGDTDNKCKMLRKRLSNDHSKIFRCLEDLGIICAYEAVKICIENSEHVKEECEFYSKCSKEYKSYLEAVLSVIGESLPQDHDKLLGVGYNSSEIVARSHISPKLHELLEIFKSFGKASQVSCLIFVERIITAKVIERIIKKMTSLSHFAVSYITGSNSSVDALAPKAQRKTLELFRAGKVNLLFATDVVEEGIHVSDCSSVIRFDLPKTVRSYVQSRGRARQNDSQYIVMLERGNLDQRHHMFDLIRSECSMTNTALNRDSEACFIKACVRKETDAYYVEATGASVSADSSLSLLQKYCARLPGDKYFIPKPEFRHLLVGESYQSKLTLPSNAAFRTMIGPLARNSTSSKQLVCLEACKRLHQLGALDDHLLPIDEQPSQSDSCKKTSTSGAGTTKRKELHGTTCVRMLSGIWGDKCDGVSFQAYKIDFSCNIAEEHYSNFVLLIESQLDDDVGNFELELYLISKFVKSTVSACGQIHLDGEQVAKAKCFHELLFNGLFGKLFIKSSGERKFLFQTEETLWHPSNMYLVLPLHSLNNCHEPWRINWEGIESCVSAVEFLKKYAWLNADKSESSRKKLLVDRAKPVGSESESRNIIHLANKSISVSKIRNMVVVAIHTGRIYTILEVVDNTSAESPFDANTEAGPSGYSSFADYFRKKYGLSLVHPGQPLLLLKQSHNAHNLLVDFRNESTLCGKKVQGDNNLVVEKPRCHIHMPPELLVGIDVPSIVLRSFYLLPSLMHRMESLMLASQLREEIACYSGNLRISSSLILEALTTLRCNESFSMERLELLGDSVLKYAVSCHLFLNYPEKHEGHLSARRSWAVCNSTLHKLGIDCKLQGYIRDCAFDPRRWIAPGQCPIWLFPCDHGLDTPDVPLEREFLSEDTKIVVGKWCDRGHRWMGSKTISDCVEALIGAYYVGGGLIAALQLMKWLGIDADVEPSLIDQAMQRACLHSYSPELKNIETLEEKLGHQFRVKGLLLEAITHATEQDQDTGVCYQRLEFLGDSVLDILITQYLYQKHSDIDPGELTDLRSASVNNDSFALAAVRRKLHLHLRHCSGFLENQISEYVKSVSQSCDVTKPQERAKAPKVLGDLVESITGAVLIDTKLNLDEVWRIFEPLLSPIVTPDKLELPPLRELIELCDSLGYFLKEKCIPKVDKMHAELILQLEEVRLVGEGFGHNRKAAKGQAALHLLKNLEKRGISNSRRRKGETDDVGVSSVLDSEGNICSKDNDEAVEPKSCKKQKIVPLHSGATEGCCSNSDLEGLDSNNPDAPVLAPINMKKGGPRISLFDLCKRLQWPMPTFEATEHKSRSPIVFGEGSETRTGFSSFESQITLTIPNFRVLILKGAKRADKKSSFDSAAFLMLRELERLGRVVIQKQ